MALLSVELLLFAAMVSVFSGKIAHTERAAATLGLAVGTAVALAAVVLINPSV